MERDNVKARRELNYRLYLKKTAETNNCPYPSNEEKYKDICCGNTEAASGIIANAKAHLCEREGLSDVPLKNMLYNFIISLNAAADACTESGLSTDEACALADIYIGKADKCPSEDKLCELYGQALLDFAERMREIKKETAVSIHVRRCIDYIYGHLGEPLTVNSLAQYCGIDPSYLSNLFVRETGTKLRQFVLSAKTDTAKNLLRYSGLSYLDISSALGFSSQSAFISVFKKNTGTTPKKYREKGQNL